MNDNERFVEVERRRRTTQDSIDRRGNKFCRRGGESVDLSVELGKYKRVIEKMENALVEELGVIVNAEAYRVRLHQFMKEEGLEVK